MGVAGQPAVVSRLPALDLASEARPLWRARMAVMEVAAACRVLESPSAVRRSCVPLRKVVTAQGVDFGISDLVVAARGLKSRPTSIEPGPSHDCSQFAAKHRLGERR